jgi:hypothetical protein
MLQLSEHPRSRSKATNKPFAGIPLNTAQGRRIRDLTQQLLGRYQGVVDELTIADAVSAAKLKVRAEQALIDDDVPLSELLRLVEMADKASGKFTAGSPS